MPRGNPERLVPNEARTPEERRNNARKAGIASGEARRAKKTMAGFAQAMLRMTVGKGRAVDLETIKSIRDISHKNITVEAAIVAAQVRKALNGDERAATFIRDLTGQMPVIEQSITAKVSNPYEGLTTEQLIALAEKDE